MRTDMHANPHSAGWQANHHTTCTKSPCTQLNAWPPRATCASPCEAHMTACNSQGQLQQQCNDPTLPLMTASHLVTVFDQEEGEAHTSSHLKQGTVGQL